MALARQVKNSVGQINFGYMFIPDYIEVYGPEHYEASVQAMEEVTKLMSAEFAVRPFHLPFEKEADLNDPGDKNSRLAYPFDFSYFAYYKNSTFYESYCHFLSIESILHSDGSGTTEGSTCCPCGRHPTPLRAFF